MPSAECHTDHRMVRCRLNFHFKPVSKRRVPPKRRLHLAFLNYPHIEANFQASIESGLQRINEDTSLTQMWNHMQGTIMKTAEEVLGYLKRKNRDWFDENNLQIQQLLSKKRSAHQAYLAQPSSTKKKAAFRQACSILQRELRDMQN